ncbi:FemAB family XrtA/PEP-CTERM system-associated protein [Marinobacter sp. F4216]|uniref:FemAB family XrtA/PEP-CTERM system-associated protein n=1 Tax=Marinobacter sp. F4216 TaxID=2874281 RepID=UPI001CBCC06B|nr:FemAB family XrtA/PEP-CTERM system-associated protein [Marinobacter sp. F4216]MBZ2167846.1 FemAB family PEP-CTERM system-associated protein [Marinobacter sp. F4216]
MQLESVSNPHEELESRLSFLQEENKRLGRLVDKARESTAPAEDLLGELQRNIKEIKALKKRVKQNQNKSIEKSWSPPKISVPQAILNQSVTEPLEVKVASHEHSLPIDQYVAGHPAGSIWHSTAVTSFIGATCKHQIRYFLAIDKRDQVVGVLPVTQMNSYLFGNFMVSVPYFNYGGVLADNGDVARKLIQAADCWRAEMQSKHMELRHFGDSGLGLRQRSHKVTFWLPLPTNPRDLWDSFRPKLRAQIRRGQRESIEFSIGGAEFLDEFYRVFAINMRDLGTPVYGRPFFRNLLDSLGNNVWLVIGRRNGKAVTCAFLTGSGDRMEIPWASSLRRVSQTGANMAMYWRILEFAMEQGFRYFDFGRCSPESGTYKFKRQWGAQELSMHWDYVLPEGGELPALNPDNPKFKMVIEVWRRLPVWITRLIGPKIVNSLP